MPGESNARTLPQRWSLIRSVGVRVHACGARVRDARGAHPHVHAIKLAGCGV